MIINLGGVLLKYRKRSTSGKVWKSKNSPHMLMHACDNHAYFWPLLKWMPKPDCIKKVEALRKEAGL